jgi:hypothetical protein
MSGYKKAAKPNQKSKGARNGGGRKKPAARTEPGRRPIEYKGEESCRVATEMAKLGAPDGAIAAALGIGISTFHRWRQTHGDFAEALKMGNAVADAAVERSLAQRALGYSYPVEKVFLTRDGTIVRAQTVKHALPDVKAAQIWLSSRMPEVYGRKKEVGPDASANRAFLKALEEMNKRALDKRADRARLNQQGAGKGQGGTDGTPS